MFDEFIKYVLAVKNFYQARAITNQKKESDHVENILSYLKTAVPIYPSNTDKKALNTLLHLEAKISKQLPRDDHCDQFLLTKIAREKFYQAVYNHLLKYLLLKDKNFTAYVKTHFTEFFQFVLKKLREKEALALDQATTTNKLDSCQAAALTVSTLKPTLSMPLEHFFSSIKPLRQPSDYSVTDEMNEHNPVTITESLQAFTQFCVHKVGISDNNFMNKQVAVSIVDNQDLRASLFKDIEDIFYFIKAMNQANNMLFPPFEEKIFAYEDIKEKIDNSAQLEKIFSLVHLYSRVKIFELGVEKRLITTSADREKYLKIFAATGEHEVLDAIQILLRYQVIDCIELIMLLRAYSLHMTIFLSFNEEMYASLTRPEHLNQFLDLSDTKSREFYIKEFFLGKYITFKQFQAKLITYNLNFRNKNIFASLRTPEMRNYAALSQILEDFAALIKINIPIKWYFKHTELSVFVNMSNMLKFKQVSPVSFSYLIQHFPSFFLKNENIFSEVFPHLRSLANRAKIENFYFSRTTSIPQSDLHSFSFSALKTPGFQISHQSVKRIQSHDAYRYLSIYTNNNPGKQQDIDWQLMQKVSATFMNYANFFYITQFGESGFYQNKINLTHQPDFTTQATVGNKLAISLSCFIFDAFLKIRDKKTPIEILELGAGDGSLCIKIFDCIYEQAKTNPLWAELFDRIEYATLDISQRLLSVQAERIKQKCKKKNIKHYLGNALRLEESEYYLSGRRAYITLTNELLDMLPPRKIKIGQDGNWKEEFIALTVKLEDLKKHFAEIDIETFKKESLWNLQLVCRYQKIEATPWLQSGKLFLSKKQFEYLQTYYTRTTSALVNFYEAHYLELPIEHDVKLMEAVHFHAELIHREARENGKIISPAMRDYVESLNKVTHHDSEHSHFPIHVNVGYGCKMYRHKNKILPESTYIFHTFGRISSGSNYLYAPGWSDITYMPNYAYLEEEARRLGYKFILLAQNDIAKNICSSNPALKSYLTEAEGSTICFASIFSKDKTLNEIFEEEKFIVSNASVAKSKKIEYQKNVINFK